MLTDLKANELVGMIQFTSREDFDKCVTKDFLSGLLLSKDKLGYDQIIVVGKMGGVEILQVRLIKSFKNEQGKHEVCDAKDGDGGEQ